MRLRLTSTSLTSTAWKVAFALALLLTPRTSRAATCTSEAELGSLDRDALSAIDHQSGKRRDCAGLRHSAGRAAAAGSVAVGGDSRGGGAGGAAGEGRAVSVAESLRAGRERPDRAAGYAVFLLQCRGVADRHYHHECAAAGTLRRSAGRCAGIDRWPARWAWFWRGMARRPRGSWPD